MKRFLLFASYFGSGHCGGWEDFRKSYETLDIAIIAGMRCIRRIKTHPKAKWFHVVDSTTGKIVHSHDYLGRD